MANKSWYEISPREGQLVRAYLQKLINLYCFESKEIKTPEDITIDNLKDFIEIILKNYQYYHFSHNDLLSLGDAFDIYLQDALGREYLEYASGEEFDLSGMERETIFEHIKATREKANYIVATPEYPNTDRRQLVLDICSNCMQWSANWVLLPEDVPFVLECLNAPDNENINMYDKLDDYFEQFDIGARFDELAKRRKILTEERLKALRENQPLPIRPMSIELDMCYKKIN